ncbi:hypothetical protein D3C71_1555080 [compost metagenome]
MVVPQADNNASKATMQASIQRRPSGRARIGPRAVAQAGWDRIETDKGNTET